MSSSRAHLVAVGTAPAFTKLLQRLEPHRKRLQLTLDSREQPQLTSWPVLGGEGSARFELRATGPARDVLALAKQLLDAVSKLEIQYQEQVPEEESVPV